MAAGTTVILNFRPPSPPPPAALSRLQNRIFPVKSATVCRESLAGSRCRRLNLTTVRASQRPSQAAFGGNNDYSTAVLTLATELQNFVLANFLPLALVCGVILGITCPKLGCAAHRYSLSKFSTFGIFFISGLKLQGGEIREIAEAWPAFVYGLVSILLLSPLFSKLILKVQLVPQEFVTGLAVFSCMPTALSSGVALTQLVGGNSALALALTVMSNLLGILFVPFWISKFLADGFGVAIPTGSLLRSLLITLLVPLVLGKALRTSFHGLARYVDQNRKVLSRMSTILLSFTPWMQVSKTRPLLMLMKPEVFLQAIVMGILVHVSSLIFNAFMVRSLSIAPYAWKAIFMKKENTRALLLVCSQRALVIAVAVVEQLGDALGESGLLILPCVAAHMNQIIFNSLLVNFWLQKDESFNSAKQC